jgi:thiol:disulfide interchange protein DsbD
MHFFVKPILVLLVVCGIALPGEAQLNLSTAPLDPPEMKAWSPAGGPETDADGNTTVRIAVQIPPDHHGYLDRGDEGLLIPLTFNFASLETQRVRVTEIARPQGSRDEQAHATVLRGDGEFVFRLEPTAAGLPMQSEFPAVVRYQICNDVTNICYPPRTTAVPLRFAALTDTASFPASSQPTLTAENSLTLRERITQLFRQSSNNLPLALTLVFIAGLMATATPCVYPIIPITSAILMARGAGSRRLGQIHAGVYFVGLIFFYTLLGAFAASTGTALSAIMTNPWVNLGFAVLFAYLGLSMLGLYEFQFLTTLTAKLDTASSQRSGFSGTFFMGLTAGLVVSPCVGPVVGAILLNITGNAAAVGPPGGGIPTSVLVRGIVMMTAFGTGIGLPFLVVGLLSNRLPQSGKWLTKVKFLLGLPILYFAYTYYVKSLETLGVAANIAHAMLLGIVAIVLAVFVGAFHAMGESPQRHLMLRRAGGIILLIIGVHFLYNGLARSGILIEFPQRVSVNGSSEAARSADQLPSANVTPAEAQGNLHWLRDVALARQQASAEQKPLFVDFYANWCANCKAFGRLTLRDTALNTALQDAVLIKVYDTDADFKMFQQDSRFPELRGVGGQPFLPLFAIYSPQGEFVWKGQDYQAVGTMIAQLERARQRARQTATQ